MFVVEMRDLIGGRTLRNLLLGGYHRPKREERIFLFLDLEGSTRLAAEVGDVCFHAFLSRFFFDADEIVFEHGGEVHSYVGDAMIATWPLAGPDDNARPVEAVLEIRDYARDAAERYRAEFGFAPAFRAALHGGPVVAGECGGTRRQITYLGDVVNTTARMEQLCKALDCRLLVSKPLLQRMALPPHLRLVDHGEQELRGTRAPVRVSSIADAN